MLQHLNRLDHELFESIQLHLRSGISDSVFLMMRDKYFWTPFYIFLVSWLFFTYGKQAWKLILLCLLTVTISDLLNSSLIKSIVQRDRPCREIYFKDQFTPVIDCSGGYSFPSSHAVNHMGIASVLFFVCQREMKKWKWLLVFWALLIGWSQIYIGVHFPFDVLTGWVEGFAVGYLIFKLIKKFIGIRYEDPERSYEI